MNLYSVNASLDIEDADLFNRGEVSMVMDNNNLHPELDLCKISLFYDWLESQGGQSAGDNRVFFMDCSDKSVVDEQFHQRLIDLLDAHQDTNPMLCIGVSEKILADEEDRARGFIDLVRSLGCKCAITEVSTSYLSQKAMNSLPLEYLKIDSTLINNLETDESSFLTVKYITELSHLADLKSIVENISNLQLLDKLKSIKVDYAQEVQKQVAAGVS